jgi:hypothetical protein
MDVVVMKMGISPHILIEFSTEHPDQCELFHCEDALLMFLFLLHRGVELPLSLWLDGAYGPEKCDFGNSFELIKNILFHEYVSDMEFPVEYHMDLAYFEDFSIRKIWPTTWGIPSPTFDVECEKMEEQQQEQKVIQLPIAECAWRLADVVVEMGISRDHLDKFAERYPGRSKLSRYEDAMLLFLFLLHQGVKLPRHLLLKCPEFEDEPEPWSFFFPFDLIDFILSAVYKLDIEENGFDLFANKAYLGDADIQGVWPPDWEIPEPQQPQPQSLPQAQHQQQPQSLTQPQQPQPPSQQQQQQQNGELEKKDQDAGKKKRQRGAVIEGPEKKKQQGKRA